MLQIQNIRTDFQGIKARLDKRAVNYEDLLRAAIDADDQRKNAQTMLDGKLSQMNQLSKEIGGLF